MSAEDTPRNNPAHAIPEHLRPRRNVEDMPHVLVCRYTPWADNPRLVSKRVALALLEKHMMFRWVCPWDANTPLKAGDIAIVGEGVPESKINAELVRLRKLGVKAERIPFLGLMGDLRQT